MAQSVEDTSLAHFGNDARERLRQHFDVPLAEHNNHWDSLWATQEFLPWDRGQPNPALIDILSDRQDLLGTPMQPDGKTRKRVLVPGCGKGYDVLLLAAMGYDAYGLEISGNALKACEKFATENFADYSKMHNEYGVGSYNFILGDFFNDEFCKKISANGFDLIYDYTFMCAMRPEMRPDWALRHTQLLASGPDSRLVCLEFPTSKDLKSGGPPFGVRPETYVAFLSRPGEDLPLGEDGNLKTHAPEAKPNALVRIAHWQPDRTHEIGKGTDWISVWKHHNS